MHQIPSQCLAGAVQQQPAVATRVCTQTATCRLSNSPTPRLRMLGPGRYMAARVKKTFATRSDPAISRSAARRCHPAPTYSSRRQTLVRTQMPQETGAVAICPQAIMHLAQAKPIPATQLHTLEGARKVEGMAVWALVTVLRRLHHQIHRHCAHSRDLKAHIYDHRPLPVQVRIQGTPLD